MTNHLYYGDNLAVLRDSIADESVDLIYLDPPFNSNASYNVLFKGPKGTESAAQIEAFDDTWHWTDAAEEAFGEVMRSGNGNVAEMLRAMRTFLGDNDMMAYLTMMAVRLLELHRVLKSTGSLYLHCDPTASHYLKILLDAVFGATNFRTEIVWKRTSSHNDAKHAFPDLSDIVLFYSKTKNSPFKPIHTPHSSEYVEKFYRHNDNDGRGPYTLDNMASPSARPLMMYEWKGFPFPPLGWRYKLETMTKLDDEKRIYYPTHSDGSFDISKRPRLKRYLDEQKGPVLGNIWTDIHPLSAHAQERMGYPTQKPVALLERILNASTTGSGHRSALRRSMHPR